MNSIENSFWFNSFLLFPSYISFSLFSICEYSFEIFITLYIQKHKNATTTSGNVLLFSNIKAITIHKKIIILAEIITFDVVLAEYVIVFHMSFVLLTIFLQICNHHIKILPIIDVLRNCFAFILFIIVVIVITEHIYITKYAVIAIEIIAS